MLIVAPHVFQGTKFDVSVPESSRHLERFFGASLKSSKASLYILPGRIIARYWSEQRMLTIMHDMIVTATRPPLVPLALSLIHISIPANAS